MTDKELYRALCLKEHSIPVYAQDWWLDCVCGENRWNVLLILQDGLVSATIPYYMPCRGIITMPPFTQTMGIWFNPVFEMKRTASELYRRQTVCEEFIRRLPAHSYFLQNFHYSFTDWLPFYWNGFRQTTRYSFLLHDIKDKETLYNNLGRSIKENLKKANKNRLQVRRNVPIDEFIKINAQVFARQSIKVAHQNTLRKLVSTAVSRKQGNIWGAYDEQGKLHAAVFVVWQDDCAYAIANGTYTHLRKSGGLSLVLLQAISDLSSSCTVFDFCGSMIKGVEFFFREFGTTQKQYFQIEKGKMNILNRIQIKLKQKINA
ncbi:MAG: GNAT family N-acetyltransferase [Dysgonamonadaceae bacterium]|nr:GNAT family N-acetyltransferase [Dysgonamonadaceae bacterium]